MNIKKLELGELASHIRKVRKALSGQGNSEALLDGAFADFPAVANLFQWMQELAQPKKRKKRKNRRALRMMERDFLLLLALRDIQNEQEAHALRLKVVGAHPRDANRRN